MRDLALLYADRWKRWAIDRRKKKITSETRQSIKRYDYIESKKKKKPGLHGSKPHLRIQLESFSIFVTFDLNPEHSRHQKCESISHTLQSLFAINLYFI